MNKELQQKIEQTLNSLEGIRQAEAPPYLYSKIMNRLQPAEAVFQTRIALRLVAALVVVLLLNAFTLQALNRSEKGEKETAQAVAQEYAISLPNTY